MSPRHSVEAAAAPVDVPVEADENQLRQILWNLATNGLRAMPDGGALQLAARSEVDGDGRAWAVLDVTDHGVGMSPGRWTALQPFRGSFGQGTGLGGHRAPHRHRNRGRIDVRSSRGQARSPSNSRAGDGRPPPDAAAPIAGARSA